MERISGSIPVMPGMSGMTGPIAARPVRPPSTGQPASQPTGQAEKKTAGTTRRFDTVLISENANANANARSGIERSLCSRVSQEVRATGATGRLSALRAQVQGGTYRADPLSVARSMLRMPEEA